MVGNFVFLVARMAGFGEAKKVDIVEIYDFKQLVVFEDVRDISGIMSCHDERVSEQEL